MCEKFARKGFGILAAALSMIMPEKDLGLERFKGDFLIQFFKLNKNISLLSQIGQSLAPKTQFYKKWRKTRVFQKPLDFGIFRLQRGI